MLAGFMHACMNAYKLFSEVCNTFENTGGFTQDQLQYNKFIYEI